MHFYTLCKVFSKNVFTPKVLDDSIFLLTKLTDSNNISHILFLHKYIFIHTNLYGEITSEEIINFYSQYNECDYYVFKRKMHNGNNYHAYLKANGQSASEDTLSQPAFPTYLLPPESVIQEIEKSPKLRLELEGFRKNNWEDIIGSYVGNVDEICPKTKRKV